MDELAELKSMSAAAMQVSDETETGLDTIAQPIPSIVPEKFIPVDRKDIIKRVLAKQYEPETRELATEVFRYMCALRQVESAKLLDDLVEGYDAFNPDDETVNEREIVGVERRLQLDSLRAKVIDLVVSANYLEIDQKQLQEALDEQGQSGFAAEVDLQEYDFHMLYYRGHIKDHRHVRSWKRLWLKDMPQECDAYRRLFLGLKLKPFDVRVQEIMQSENLDKRRAEKRVKKLRNRAMLEGVSEDTLHLKVFRRIPKDELRILFPNARIKFKLFDQLWLWFGSGGSTIFAIVVAVLKFLAAVAISLFFVLITLAGALGAIMRSVTNFFNTRTRYMMKLAKSLYFHNLASNQSVLTLLTDEAEEEDIKEAVLTYSFLLKYGHRGLSDVRYEIEKFLKDEFDVDLAFDIEDGCVHLRRLGLFLEDETGAPGILDLEDAYTHLLKSWSTAVT